MEEYFARCFFMCRQHYVTDNVNVSLRYSIKENSGIISINGVTKSKSAKMFNRKIAFTVRKDGDIYYMLSNKILKSPEDNVDDTWLSLRQPLFFTYPNKSIYIRIIQLNNKKYLFMIGYIPTYICNII